MTLEYRIGDVFDRLAEIPDGSIDLIVTSPPFLALRSYLPADHPDKGKEIGSEATPADFLDTLLALSAEWGRVLAPHGSLCVELGDTYSGNGGGDAALSYRMALNGERSKAGKNQARDTSAGWPLPKSRTMIDTLYPACLAYNRNLLTGQPSPAGQWRIRNLIVWARPNPPVGALGDKFRPATSYITVACRGVKRYFDLDAVRSDHAPNLNPRAGLKEIANPDRGTNTNGTGDNPAGAPPLDWHTDHHPEDGDWLWKMSTQPYSGSHYATFPMALPKRLIEAMCPLRVCTVCGRPSERITEVENLIDGKPVEEFVSDHVAQRRSGWEYFADNPHAKGMQAKLNINNNRLTQTRSSEWSDCGHGSHNCRTCGFSEISANADRKLPACCLGSRDLKYVADHWRTGIVLDPFAGSGTTLEAAQAVGRHAIGIDLDHRNADLARERCGMFMDVVA